jgi:hypothetical protein
MSFDFASLLQFPDRKDVYQSNPTLYENERAIFRVFQKDKTGALVLTKTVASFSQMVLLRVDEVDQERIQTALSSDGSKIWAFDRAPRVYACAATLLDTQLDAPIESINGSNVPAWTGRGHKEWVEFYNDYAKLSTAAKNRYVVQFSYGKRQVYGAIQQANQVIQSALPHRVDVTFLFFVTYAEDLTALQGVSEEDDFNVVSLPQ